MYHIGLNYILKEAYYREEFENQPCLMVTNIQFFKANIHSGKFTTDRYGSSQQTVPFRSSMQYPLKRIGSVRYNFEFDNKHFLNMI